jgi:hypothetical protein
MPTVQSTYPDNIRVAVAGMRANEEPCTLISRTVEDAAGIGFGLGVMQGTLDKGCVVSDGSTLLGVTVRDRSVDPATPDLFAEYASARIMTIGTIWVEVSGAVAAGDSVHALAAGALGNDGGTFIENARWDTSAADGELAILRPAVGCTRYRHGFLRRK